MWALGVSPEEIMAMLIERSLDSHDALIWLSGLPQGITCGTGHLGHEALPRLALKDCPRGMQRNDAGSPDEGCSIPTPTCRRCRWQGFASGLNDTELTQSDRDEAERRFRLAQWIETATSSTASAFGTAIGFGRR
jgi:hypothetical protein